MSEPEKTEDVPVSEPPKAKAAAASKPSKAKAASASKPPTAEDALASEPPKADPLPASEPEERDALPASEPEKIEAVAASEPQKILDSGPAPPHGRYRRQIDGAGFSLEACTERVPDDGRFYVLRGDEVELATDDFGEAQQVYYDLCRAFWMERLESDDLSIRISAAWGLISLNPTDKIALAVIQEFGSPQERKRLEQAQSRRRALRARARGRRSSSTAASS